MQLLINITYIPTAEPYRRVVEDECSGVAVVHIYSGSDHSRKTDQEKTGQKNQEGVVLSAKYNNSTDQREVGKTVNNHVTVTQVAKAISVTQEKMKMKQIISLNYSGPPVHNAENKQNDGGWETVKKNRRNGKQNVIIGNNSSGVKGVGKRSFLHVSRVKPDTKVEDMELFLKVNFPGMTVEKWNSKYPNVYSSFIIGILQSQYKSAMFPDIWPANASVRNFLHKKEKVIFQG
nr:unnamed protein product [Callosobruchus analis]